MRKELTCPVCQKIKLKRLSNHLDKVHRVTGSEKVDLLRKARNAYVYTAPISFMDFFLSLRIMPLTCKEYKFLNQCRKHVDAAWDSRTIRDLPPRLIKMLKDAHERFLLMQGQC